VKLLYPLAKRFIAGYNFDSAKSSINKLLDDGYEVSVDYVGEHSKTIRDCKAAFKQYLKIIKYFNGKNIDVSIKPTQLGMLINPYFSWRFVTRIAKRAKENGHTIRLDMEDTNVTELTRNLAISLNKKYGNVGVAIQANLNRSEEDIGHLIDNNVSVRLVKGAYKGDLDTATVQARFASLAYHLKSRGANRPAIATHDEDLLTKIDHDFFDYEFLYGIRRDLQRELKNKGRRVRIYIPFGEHWLPYVVRRLKEWKNLKFVSYNIIKESIKWNKKRG
jgi:proline dehydrogenase|tara:strand:- start:795 stop:1622 length:828 start_codon:yes stop_codon:yes gene_type:complete